MAENKKNDPTAWFIIGFIVLALIALVAFILIKSVLPNIGGNTDNFGPPVEMQPDPDAGQPAEVEAEPLPESEGMQPEPEPEEPQ